MVTPQLTKDLQDCTSCTVCMEQYDNGIRVPKLLPCGHTFCLSCLNPLAPQNSGEITCPICRSKHKLSFHACLDLSTMRVIQRRKFPTNRAVLDMVDSLEQNTKSAGFPCSAHPDRECMLMCMDCLVGLCSKCVTAIGKHRDHTLEELPEAKTALQEKFLKQFQEEQAMLEPKMAEIDTSVKEITKLEASVQNINDEIMSWATQQQATLRTMREKLQEIQKEKEKLSQEQNMDIPVSSLVSLVRSFKDTVNRNIRGKLETVLKEIDGYDLQENWKTILGGIMCIIDHPKQNKKRKMSIRTYPETANK